MSLQEWINILKGYPNLKTIYFIGTRSEHTLYPYFLELCEYIKGRSISIVLSTNGCTKTENWWNKLRDVLNNTDEVRFAIDGCTQEIYEKYRVGGSLTRVLLNHKAFKSSKCNDTIQYITFNHNEHEDTTHMFNKFSKIRVINSSYSTSEIRPTNEYMHKYDILNKLIKYKKEAHIVCETKEKMHFIDCKGKVSPCCHYNEHSNDVWDYTYDNIENGKYDFCTMICDKTCSKLRKEMGVEL